MVYATGHGEHGEPIDVRDPLAARFAQVTADKRTAEALVEAYFGFPEVFGSDLPENPHFREEVTRALAGLLSIGAARTVFEAGSR